MSIVPKKRDKPVKLSAHSFPKGLSMYRYTFFVIAFVSGLTGCIHSSVKVSDPTQVKRVVLESSQIFDHYSKLNDYSYRIRVNLPSSYQSNTDKKYPVILKLDGQWDFPLAAGAYNCVYFDGQMPETIVIGIGWGEVEGDIHAIRSRDLMPSPIKRYVESGHAKEFVNVLAKEIIPELERRFRLNGQRFLMGTSMSALFATYALLEQPETFDGAIAIGADFGSAKGVLTKQIESLANTDRLAGKRLYLGVGSLDAIAPGVQALSSELHNADLNDFKLMFELAPGYGHSSMNLPGYANGYRLMFERDHLYFDQKLLTGFTGEYYTPDTKGSKLLIRANSEGLVAETAWGEKIQLWAKSANEFYHPGMFFRIRFENGQAFVETFYGKQQLNKVKPVPVVVNPFLLTD